MQTGDLGTEGLIMEAAKKVFLQKGFDGTRLQDIAAEAGINKALLHYYFRNKDKLFSAVFMDALVKFFPRIKEVLASDLTFEEKIRLFVTNYIGLLQANPHIPMFILHELQRNPEKFYNLIKSNAPDPARLLEMIRTEIREKRINRIDPRQFLVNLLSLCIFPFAARPVLQGLLFGNDPEAFDRFLEERKSEIFQFVIEAIKIK